MSPYELLCASKPKPPQTVTTEYDLYSLSLPACEDVPPSQKSIIHTPVQNTAFPPAKRTHYIADIHARHSSAIRQAAQDSRPL